eukprot:Lankesteria_metandrocarpae@DN9187_c0_g1_i1.p1
MYGRNKRCYSSGPPKAKCRHNPRVRCWTFKKHHLTKVTAIWECIGNAGFAPTITAIFIFDDDHAPVENPRIISQVALLAWPHNKLPLYSVFVGTTNGTLYTGAFYIPNKRIEGSSAVHVLQPYSSPVDVNYDVDPACITALMPIVYESADDYVKGFLLSGDVSGRVLRQSFHWQNDVAPHGNCKSYYDNADHSIEQLSPVPTSSALMLFATSALHDTGGIVAIDATGGNVGSEPQAHTMLLVSGARRHVVINHPTTSDLTELEVACVGSRAHSNHDSTAVFSTTGTAADVQQGRLLENAVHFKESVRIMCPRPGGRVWVANHRGIVERTCKFDLSSCWQAVNRDSNVLLTGTALHSEENRDPATAIGRSWNEISVLTLRGDNSNSSRWLVLWKRTNSLHNHEHGVGHE